MRHRRGRASIRCSPEKIAELERHVRERNRLSANPRQECESCGFPTFSEDLGDFFPARCSICEGAWLTGVLARLVSRLGPSRAAEALMQLADAE